jgi:hypothetical protein
MSRSLRAFIGGATPLTAAEARRGLILAALELAFDMEGCTGHADRDFISHTLWETAREAGLTEKETDRIVAECVEYQAGRGSLGRGMPAELAHLTAARKADRLEARLAALWGDDEA